MIKQTSNGAVEGEGDHLGRLLDRGIGGAGDDGAVGRAEAVGQHALRQVASGSPGCNTVVIIVVLINLIKATRWED